MAYKPSAFEICSASVGLDVKAGRGQRRAFTLAELRQAGAKGLAQRVAWLKRFKIIQGPDRGPFALTEKGVRVVGKACKIAFKRGR